MFRWGLRDNESRLVWPEYLNTIVEILIISYKIFSNKNPKKILFTRVFAFYTILTHFTIPTFSRKINNFKKCSGHTNLGRVDFITNQEYDLFIRPDTANPRARFVVTVWPDWHSLFWSQRLLQEKKWIMLEGVPRAQILLPSNAQNIWFYVSVLSKVLKQTGRGELTIDRKYAFIKKSIIITQ